MNNNKEIRLSDIPLMDVNRMTEKLSHAYISIINNGLPIRTMPSVML